MARTLVRRIPSIRLSVPRRALARGARAAGTAAAKAAASEKHTLAAVGAAAVYGYMRGRGVALPYVAALGQAGTYGLVTWALGRYTRSRTMQHVATGLLSVAAAEFAGAATPGAAPGAAAMGGEF